MNLVEASTLFRKIVAICAGLVGLYITFLIIKAPVSAIIASLNPSREAPSAVFGKIDAPQFQYKKLTNTDPQYILNTKNGRLPTDLRSTLPVFRLRQPLFSYEAGKNAQKTATLLGYFDDTFRSLTTDQIYTWEDPTFNSRLDINTKTREVNLNLPLFGKGDFYNIGKLNQNTAVETAKNMLIAAGRFSDMYYSGTSKTFLGKFVGGEIRPVDFDYETQIIRVDFYRSFTGFPILGPDPYKGLLHVWVGSPKEEKYKQLIFPRVEAYQWELVDREKDQEAIYPLIPVSLAWQEVSENRGVIAGVLAKDGNPFESYVPIRIDKILVNKIYLAYYDSPKLQKYLQPIYVFEGNYTTVGGGAGQISIYYPAVSGEYVLSIEDVQGDETPQE